jgi:hypothetical protein
MSEAAFTAWAIVELFGRQVTAGRISEQTIGGETFLRLDIPRAEGGEYTRLFGKGAIYAINICEEATARSYAIRTHAPLQPYVALPAPADSPDPHTDTGLRPETYGRDTGSHRDPDDDRDEDDDIEF